MTLSSEAHERETYASPSAVRRRWWLHPFCWCVGHFWLKEPAWPLTCGRCGRTWRY